MEHIKFSIESGIARVEMNRNTDIYSELIEKQVSNIKKLKEDPEFIKKVISNINKFQLKMSRHIDHECI